VGELQFQFEWDEVKANGNVRKHGVSFHLARTIFNDPRLLTLADLQHGETRNGGFQLPARATAAVLSVVYLWSEVDPAAQEDSVNFSAQSHTNRIRYYREGS
jgi:uncharacterized DUF497 family protein